MSQDRTQRLAAAARLLLPHLASRVCRCVREGRDPGVLLREVVRAVGYIERANGQDRLR